MQNPRDEIRSVIHALIDSTSALAQQRAMAAFFTPDASLDHTLCLVRSSPTSRDDGVLPTYQCLKVLSASSMTIQSVAFDEDKLRLYVDCKQQIRARPWPFSLYYAPVLRLVVILHLVKQGDKYYIRHQEDWYPFREVPGKLFFVPPFFPALLDGARLLIGWNCKAIARVAQKATGVWDPREEERREGKSHGEKAMSALRDALAAKQAPGPTNGEKDEREKAEREHEQHEHDGKHGHEPSHEHEHEARAQHDEGYVLNGESGKKHSQSPAHGQSHAHPHGQSHSQSHAHPQMHLHQRQQHHPQHHHQQHPQPHHHGHGRDHGVLGGHSHREDEHGHEHDHGEQHSHGRDGREHDHDRDHGHEHGHDEHDAPAHIRTPKQHGRGAW